MLLSREKSCSGCNTVTMEPEKLIASILYISCKKNHKRGKGEGEEIINISFTVSSNMGKF